MTDRELRIECLKLAYKLPVDFTDKNFLNLILKNSIIIYNFAIGHSDTNIDAAK